jgi:hypothetical protein
MNRTRLALVPLAIAAIAMSAGCSQKYAAERDGKQLGESICDLRDADDQDAAQAALDDITEQLDDLGGKYAVYTAEDRADVENNLADLAEHVIQGQPNLAQQDLTVLERSVDNISESVNETSSAMWEGVSQGLSECTQ